MTKTSKMHVAAINRFGGADEIKPHDVLIPTLARDEVLIRLNTAGVGSWDPYMRDGQYFKDVGAKAHFPFVLGVDGAGAWARKASGARSVSANEIVASDESWRRFIVFSPGFEERRGSLSHGEWRAQTRPNRRSRSVRGA